MISAAMLVENVGRENGVAGVVGVVVVAVAVPLDAMPVGLVAVATLFVERGGAGFVKYLGTSTACHKTMNATQTTMTRIDLRSMKISAQQFGRLHRQF